MSTTLTYKELLALHSDLKNDLGIAEVHQMSNGDIEPGTGKQIFKLLKADGSEIGPVSFDPAEWQHYNKTFKITFLYEPEPEATEDFDSFIK